MTGRRYARTSRVNELLREIIADELERIDDERLELVTVSGVETDAGLASAVVYYSSMRGAEGDDETLEALDDHRRRLQGQIGRQARMHNTPVLTFAPDAGIRAGARVEEILRDLHDSGELAEGSEEPDRSEEPEGDGRPDAEGV